MPFSNILGAQGEVALGQLTSVPPSLPADDLDHPPPQKPERTASSPKNVVRAKGGNILRAMDQDPQQRNPIDYDALAVQWYTKLDQTSLNQLAQHLFPSLCGIAEKLLDDSSEAADIANQTLADIAHRPDNWKTRKNFRAFCYGWLANNCRNANRKYRRLKRREILGSELAQPDHDGDDPFESLATDPTPVPDAQLEQREKEDLDRRRVEMVLSKLNKEQKIVLWLKVAEEMDFGHIASILHRTTIGARLFYYYTRKKARMFACNIDKQASQNL
jgi:RNA polymerase sigma factor (sigma-70 family)